MRDASPVATPIIGAQIKCFCSAWVAQDFTLFMVLFKSQHDSSGHPAWEHFLCIKSTVPSFAYLLQNPVFRVLATPKKDGRSEQLWREASTAPVVGTMAANFGLSCGFEVKARAFRDTLLYYRATSVRVEGRGLNLNLQLSA